MIESGLCSQHQRTISRKLALLSARREPWSTTIIPSGPFIHFHSIQSGIWTMVESFSFDGVDEVPQRVELPARIAIEDADQRRSLAI